MVDVRGKVSSSAAETSETESDGFLECEPFFDTSCMRSRSLTKDELRTSQHELIDLVNHLQIKFAASGKTLDVSLPQIVVVGCQSAGKSTVLESLIGREILPRGTGVVTRRPTIIQLTPSNEEYIQFPHRGNEKFIDFNLVKKEISDETLRNPGPKGFSSVPITVKVFSPKVLKLTLVDLPGIIKVAMTNQSEAILQEIRNMILSYIRQPNCLILAICPANQDLATCDSLEISKIVDPDRKRTLGVLTKLDLMDYGTHASAILNNEVLPLPRGYVGVVGRSQRDIDGGRTIEEALRKEKDFFEQHPAYRSFASRMGSSYLRTLLHMQLREHIRSCLPRMRREIITKLSDVRHKLKQFDALLSSRNEEPSIQSYVIRQVEKMKENFNAELFGNSDTMFMHRPSIGSIIKQDMHVDLMKICCSHLKIDKESLTVLLGNEIGIRATVTVPPSMLEAALFSIMKTFKEPLQGFVDLITDRLLTAIEKSMEEVSKYQVLRNELSKLIGECVDRCSEETKDLIEKYLSAETSYFNLYHKDFSAPTANSTDNTKPQTDVDVLVKILKSYMDLIVKQVTDITIKHVVNFLIKGVANFTNTDLVADLLTSPNFNAILEDCSAEFMQRKKLLELCQALEEALNAIHTF